jgi:hypothetical protein
MNKLQNNIILLLFFLVITLLQNGCSTVGNLKASSFVSPALAVGGGTLGAYATRGESEGTQIAATAAGGFTGWLAGLFLTEGIEKEKKDEFRTGYELGQSNATKSLYWSYQKLHEGKKSSHENIVYVNLPSPQINDGAKRAPSYVAFPIVSNKQNN